MRHLGFVCKLLIAKKVFQYPGAGRAQARAVTGCGPVRWPSRRRGAKEGAGSGLKA